MQPWPAQTAERNTMHYLDREALRWGLSFGHFSPQTKEPFLMEKLDHKLIKNDFYNKDAVRKNGTAAIIHTSLMTCQFIMTFIIIVIDNFHSNLPMSYILNLSFIKYKKNEKYAFQFQIHEIKITVNVCVET